MHKYFWFCALVAGLGGFIFGYHTAIIAGAMRFLEDEFQFTSSVAGVTVSIILLGALVGSFFAGMMADRFGRKAVFYFSSILVIVGTLVAILAHDTAFLLTGRFLSGGSVGLYSVVVPMYLGEISPKEHRGSVVALYQVTLAIGMLVAYGIALLLNAKGSWRDMFALGIAPGLIQLISLPFLAESPQWLLSKGRNEKSAKEEKRLQIVADASITSSCAGWKVLFSSNISRVLFVGLALSAFQQLTGINAIFYYAPELFKLIGFGSQNVVLYVTIGIGFINLIATFIAALVLDRLGRRILLLTGITGMAISLAVLAFTSYMPSLHLQIPSIVSVLAYVFFFGISLGPITWVMLAEIYPLNIRGKAMSLAILINWIFNYLISLSFLIFIEWMGTKGIFTLYCALSFIALYFVAHWLPETKGKSSDEIQALFHRTKLM